EGTTTGHCGVKNANTEDTINPAASNGVNEGAATSTAAFYSAGAVHVNVSSSGDTPTGSVQGVVAPPSTPTGSPAADLPKPVSLDADGNAVVTLPTDLSGSKRFDVAYLPTDFGANSDAGGHVAMGSSYDEFTAKVASSAVGTKVKAVAKPSTLANASKS